MAIVEGRAHCHDRETVKNKVIAVYEAAHVLLCCLCVVGQKDCSFVPLNSIDTHNK
jgi:hypothetical protein